MLIQEHDYRDSRLLARLVVAGLLFDLLVFGTARLLESSDMLFPWSGRLILFFVSLSALYLTGLVMSQLNGLGLEASMSLSLMSGMVSWLFVPVFAILVILWFVIACLSSVLVGTLSIMTLSTQIRAWLARLSRSAA